MSFSPSTITDGLSSAADFITGGAPVRLGPFTFQSFEVPDRIASGGTLSNTLHKLPGQTGPRVMDVMGPDRAPVTWSGIILGPGADRRKRLLENLLEAQQALDLTWGTTRRRVMLTDCQFDEGHKQIGYRVSCDIVQLPPAPQTSVKESLLDQIGDAVGVSNLTGQISAVGDALSSAQDSLQRISSVLPAVPGLAAVTMGLGTAAGLAQGAATGAGGTLSAIGTIASIASPAGLRGAVSASGVLAGGIAVASLAGAGVRAIQAL